MVSTPFVAVPPAGYGGTELVVAALVGALERGGNEVTVFATGDSRVGELRALFDEPVWPPDPYAELLHCRFAVRVVREGGFDLVHAHTPALLAFARELPVPVVYTRHHAADAALSRYYRAIPGVHHVAISARQAELADPPIREVVHHGLDPDLYPVVGPGGEAAFFLGRLSRSKAPDLAVEAARRAGMKLVVAGKAHAGDDSPSWKEELARSLALPHVRWLGSADLSAKRRLFARSRALLVPLRWEEPFGLVMLESLLAGCPVVAMPRGAAPEIVEDGRTGFLAGTVREMAAGLRRAARLDRRAIQARARERFSSGRMAERYLSVYRSALAERATGLAPSGRERGEDRWTTLAH
ncbi:MAG TPA: glycosyltransferase family 4 protein [Anaeromyxobacter sp.]|nr:glycosyltransferase family 4 protein [Anaeromyxobacter sp.]